MVNFGAALVAFSLFAVVLVVAVAAWLLARTDDKVDIETRKIRFAAATFAGILMLFIFTSVLYFVDEDGTRGGLIFEKAVTAMTPLVGVIIGYLYGSTGGGRKSDGRS